MAQGVRAPGEGRETATSISDFCSCAVVHKTAVLDTGLLALKWRRL